MDQGSTRKRSAVHNFAPTVTKFCVMWEGQALPHDTKFGNCRCEIVGRRVIFIWCLIHGSRWSGLIKAEPEYLWPVGDLWSSQVTILSGRDILCTTAMEYNSCVSNEKTTVSVSFIIKIHQTVSYLYRGCWKIQSFPRKVVNLKKRRLWEIHSKST